MVSRVESVELPTGVTLQYVEQGDPTGVPVLLLHGFGDSWHSYEQLFPHLPGDIRALKQAPKIWLYAGMATTLNRR